MNLKCLQYVPLGPGVQARTAALLILWEPHRPWFNQSAPGRVARILLHPWRREVACVSARRFPAFDGRWLFCLRPLVGRQPTNRREGSSQPHSLVCCGGIDCSTAQCLPSLSCRALCINLQTACTMGDKHDGKHREISQSFVCTEMLRRSLGRSRRRICSH